MTKSKFTLPRPGTICKSNPDDVLSGQLAFPAFGVSDVPARARPRCLRLVDSAAPGAAPGCPSAGSNEPPAGVRGLPAPRHYLPSKQPTVEPSNPVRHLPLPLPSKAIRFSSGLGAKRLACRSYTIIARHGCRGRY